MNLDQITPGMFVTVPFGQTNQVAHVVGLTSTGRVKIRAWNQSRSLWMPGLRTMGPEHLLATNRIPHVAPPALPEPAEKGMSQAANIKAVRALGLLCSITDGEFRVNFPQNREETAHYTNDAEDALGTARAMVKESQA